MFQLNAMEFSLRLEHRHEDGSWAQLEPRPSHHDPADHDPEREWANGRVYVCTSCQEEVRITDLSGGGAPPRP